MLKLITHNLPILWVFFLFSSCKLSSMNYSSIISPILFFILKHLASFYSEQLFDVVVVVVVFRAKCRISEQTLSRNHRPWRGFTYAGGEETTSSTAERERGRRTQAEGGKRAVWKKKENTHYTEMQNVSKLTFGMMKVYGCVLLCVCVCVFRRGREELAHRRAEERARHEAEGKRMMEEEEEERRKAEEEKAQRQKEEEKRLQQQVTDVFISFSITWDLVLHSDWPADLDSFL